MTRTLHILLAVFRTYPNCCGLDVSEVNVVTRKSFRFFVFAAEKEEEIATHMKVAFWRE